MAYRQYVIQVVEKCKLNVDNVVESKKEEKEKRIYAGRTFRAVFHPIRTSQSKKDILQ
jgi:hypothetical protein